MTIQDAITKAVQAGWANGYMERNGEGVPDELGFSYLLDPAFWQSLGKAMGWLPKCGACEAIADENPCDAMSGRDPMPHTPLENTIGLSEWHRFIDHLADGGTPESFFETL